MYLAIESFHVTKETMGRGFILTYVWNGEAITEMFSDAEEIGRRIIVLLGLERKRKVIVDSYRGVMGSQGYQGSPGSVLSFPMTRDDDAVLEKEHLVIFTTKE